VFFYESTMKYALTSFDSKDNISIKNSSCARADFIFVSRSDALFISNSTFAFWAINTAAIINYAELFVMVSFQSDDLNDLGGINLS
jgi:hypothetical protein